MTHRSPADHFEEPKHGKYLLVRESKCRRATAAGAKSLADDSAAALLEETADTTHLDSKFLAAGRIWVKRPARDLDARTSSKLTAKIW